MTEGGGENGEGVETRITYHKIVTYSCGDLCERVGGAGRDQDDVCPAPKLDVQYRVTDVVVWLGAVSKKGVGGCGGRRMGIVCVSSSVVRFDRTTWTRTSHSSSSVQTSTPCLRTSSGWKKVSDGLVAATCTDTSLC